jgi:hypothetical protein
MPDKSFVTVVINSHGRDLRKEKATARQRTTMRKLTMAGKSGMYSWHGIDNMMPTIFRAAHELSKNPHVPFTRKLRAFSDHMCELGFNERIQKVYETETAKLPDDELLKACKVSKKSDWFLTSQVKYNHLYAFNVNDDSNPWERNNFGIWLVDGSNEVLNSVDFDETKERNNIMRQLGFPVWPLSKTQEPTEHYAFTTTMFDLEKLLKARYDVKYVNFIDLSCRHYQKTWYERASSLFMGSSSDDEEMAEVSTSPLEQVTVANTDVKIMKQQPSGLPANWKYVQIPRNGEYAYADTKNDVLSFDFPEAKVSFKPRKLTIMGIDMVTHKPPSIMPGAYPVTLPKDWEYVYIPTLGQHKYVNTKTRETNDDLPAHYSAYGGRKVKSARKRSIARIARIARITRKLRKL